MDYKIHQRNWMPQIHPGYLKIGRRPRMPTLDKSILDTTQVIKGSGRPKLVKGSPEAKAFMARLRAMRGKGCRGGKQTKGGAVPIGLLTTIFKKAYVDYGKDWHKERKGQETEIADLDKQLLNLRTQLAKKKKGGGIKENIRDFFHGPIGWIRWGRRNARAREIEKRKKEIEELTKQLQA